MKIDGTLVIVFSFFFLFFFFLFVFWGYPNLAVLYDELIL